MNKVEPAQDNEAREIASSGVESVVPNPHRVRRWLLEYPRAVPVAIFLAIIAITALSVFAIESNVRAREDAQLSAYAKSVKSALERRGNSSSTYLRAGAALFSNVETINAQVFSQFVDDLQLDADYHGIENIGWLTVVPRSGEAEFLARTRMEQADFPNIWPRPGAALPRLAIVTYLASASSGGNQGLGYNMYSNAVLAQALDEARRSVRPTASDVVDLSTIGFAPESSETWGFVNVMPVFRGAQSLRTEGRDLSGYVFATFDATQLLDAAASEANLPEEFGVRMYSGPPTFDQALAAIGPAGNPASQEEQRITIANRDFSLVIGSDAPAVLSPLSMVTLLFGLALAGLLMLLARLLTQQAHEDQEKLIFFEEQNAIRDSLVRELNHRVKNTLANVLSILSLTKRRAKSLDDFAEGLEGRIRSLSATHDLLTVSEWSTTPMCSVVEAELGHFADDATEGLTVEGPDVELAPKDALSFGLAIHELATNAAKYGALSVPGGAVSIKWKLVGNHLAEIEWRESGGPEVPQIRKRGFGMELIEKIVAHELRYPVKIEFAREGVICVMRVPVRKRSEFEIRERKSEI